MTADEQATRTGLSPELIRIANQIDACIQQGHQKLHSEVIQLVKSTAEQNPLPTTPQDRHDHPYNTRSRSISRDGHQQPAFPPNWVDDRAEYNRAISALISASQPSTQTGKEKSKARTLREPQDESQRTTYTAAIAESVVLQNTQTKIAAADETTTHEDTRASVPLPIDPSRPTSSTSRKRQLHPEPCRISWKNNKIGSNSWSLDPSKAQ